MKKKVRKAFKILKQSINSTKVDFADYFTSSYTFQSSTKRPIMNNETGHFLTFMNNSKTFPGLGEMKLPVS